MPAQQPLPAAAFEQLQLPSETVKVLTSSNLQSTPTADASPNLLQAAPDQAIQLELNQSSITLYAELLLHVRVITLYASLSTVRNEETKAELSADGSTITVSHEGEQATIHLPLKAKSAGNASLSLPAQPQGKELSLRLQIEATENSDQFFGISPDKRKANVIPWDGASLNDAGAVSLRCKSCQGTILSSNEISAWKDLPNENWAEMMDLWHCHKPDEHHLHTHTHNNAMAGKGYAAATKLIAIKGTGFVDLTSFLFEETNCDGVQIIHGPQNQINRLTCASCSHTLGAVDPDAAGWRIWKWSIDIYPRSSNGECPPSSSMYSVEKWISVRLLFLIENQGVRKFCIHPERSNLQDIPSLLVWVFTPDLLFSSSIRTRSCYRKSTRALKIFFKADTYNPPKPGELESTSIEDLPFPDELYDDLKDVLLQSQQLLPAGARQFQGWKVGLLKRFDVDDGKGRV